MFISKGFKALGSAIVPILIFSQTAMAAPLTITYQDANGNTIQVNYQDALNNSLMKAALKAALKASETANLPIFVIDDNGSVINYTAAIGKTEDYPTALADPAVIVPSAPVATKQLNSDGSVTDIDAEKPVITLKGDATMNLATGATFTDPGVTVTDNLDTNLVAVVTGDVVDTSKAGTYVIKYDVSDKAGNAAVEVTRTVVVSAITVSSVSAVNGAIMVTLSGAPAVAPVLDDFAVTQTIGIAGATAVTPTKLSLDATGAIVTLTVPTVAATVADQSVVDSVSYKTASAVLAPAFTVTNNTAAVNAVNAATMDNTQATLEANAQVLGLDLTAYNALTDTFKTNVASAVFKGKAIQATGQYADAAAIQMAFNNAVATQTGSVGVAAALATINAVPVAISSAADDVAAADATMRSALEAQATTLGLDLTDYNNLGNYGKTQVAHLVLTDRLTGYATVAALKTEFANDVASQKAATSTAVTDVNTVAVVTRTAPLDTEVATMTNELVTNSANANALDLSVAAGSDYMLLDASYQAAVAKAVITTMPATTVGTTTTYAYANAGAIKSAFDTAVAVQKAKESNDLIANVNACTSASGVQAILDAANQAKLLGLDTTDYVTLSSTAKAAVAQTILDGMSIQPNGSYADANAINGAFKSAVAAQKTQAVAAAIAAINKVTVANAAAPTTTEGTNMEAALETNALVLGLNVAATPLPASDYANLALADKVNVGIAVLTSRPTAGFTTAADVKTAFDAAVATEKTTETQAALKIAVTAVNTASTATDMQTAIVNNASALGLSLTTNPDTTPADYSLLTATNKTAVAQKMLDDRAVQNNLQYANAGAILTEFNAAVTYYKQVQGGGLTAAALSAVNAATVATMQAVLEGNASTLGLAVGSATSPTDYYNLRADFQAAVAKAVFTLKPTAGYATSADVKSAFDTAVTAQKAAQLAQDVSIKAVNAVVMAAATPTDSEGSAMQTVLVADAQSLNLAIATGSDFDALSTGAKLQVAKGVLTARYGAVNNKFASAADIKTAFDAAVSTAKATQITAVNAINAATVTTMQSQLEANAVILSLDLTDYSNFTLGQKQQIAEAVLNGKSSVPGGKYQNAAGIKTVFTNAVANMMSGGHDTAAAVAAVNSATAQTIQTVLVSNADVLGIDVSSTSNYSKLVSDTDRASVAAAVLAAKPANNYATAGDVQTAFNNAVALNMVNKATTVSAMKAALTNLSAELAIDFTSLSADNQTAAATAVLNGKAVQAGGIYGNVAALKVVYNNAAFGDSIAPVLTSFVLNDTSGTIPPVDLTLATPIVDLSAESDSDVISSATFNVKDNLSVTNDIIKVTFSGITKTYSTVIADDTATGAANTNVPLSALLAGNPSVTVGTLRALATATSTNTLSLAVDLSDVNGNHTTGTLLIKVK